MLLIKKKENQDPNELSLARFKEALNPKAYDPKRYNHAGPEARILPAWNPNTGMWEVF